VLFQPAIIALLLAAGASAAMLVAASPYALNLIRHWDIRSGSERQLTLERRTYLLSTLLVLVLATQLVALLLFVFNADKMSAQFVGAMCAVGTLNVNAYGFPALISQMVVFFLASTWLVVNRVDSQAPDYPLTRIKYWLLLAIVPFVVATGALELSYFFGLKANVITSCCGSLFSAEKDTLAAEVSAQPPLQMMIAFYLCLAAAVAFNLQYAIGSRARAWVGYAAAATGILAFVAALAGVVSFISLYIYEHPHHHCPFCVLKPEYDYQGYWLYIPLFAATAASLGVGAVQAFARVPTLQSIAPRAARRLAAMAAALFAIFTVVATVMILRSNLLLLGD
jgi:membrane protein YdbS with pleckstrin-like domain